MLAAAAMCPAGLGATPRARYGGDFPRLREQMVAGTMHVGFHLGARGRRSVQVSANNSDDNATSALLGRVSVAQVQLLRRLAWLNQEFNSTFERAALDLEVATKAEAALLNVSQQIEAANATSQATAQSIIAANWSQQNSLSVIEDVLETIGNVTNHTAALANDAEEADSMLSISHQVADNHRLLDQLAPRLRVLADRMDAVEAKLMDGNLSEVVRDGTKRAMMDVFKDMGRGFYRFLGS